MFPSVVVTFPYVVIASVPFNVFCCFIVIYNCLLNPITLLSVTAQVFSWGSLLFHLIFNLYTSFFASLFSPPSLDPSTHYLCRCIQQCALLC